MSRVRCIEIENFRSIQNLVWFPNSGVNCLIGPGDSGKSSILEAIDLCLGGRRNIQFSDVDFHDLDITSPIKILITVGELDETQKTLDGHGLFLRSYCEFLDEITDEPDSGGELVLTVQLTVTSDLEPVWTLHSERASAQSHTRNLSWSDRQRLSPTRIGSMAGFDLTWRKGSVLNRLSDERADSGAALAKVSRDARTAFGGEANQQLENARKIVTQVANSLGVSVGDEVKALLDIDSISIGGGTISLHNEFGVPLRSLGLGSMRLLVAGLQRKASETATVILIDELEHGLEPHRIIRLLGSLGAKEEHPPLQVFMTTHSPVAIRELSGNQIFVVRRSFCGHEILKVGIDEDIQGTIRSFPDAFLAPSVLVCEGASEVGLLRGIDQFRASNGIVSFSAMGVALVDGGGHDKLFKRAESFGSIGCRVAVLRDDDVATPAAREAEYLKKDGKVFNWRKGHALEDELFHALTEAVAQQLLEKAVELHGEELVASQVSSASAGAFTLGDCRKKLTSERRATIAKIAKGKKSPWFKSVSFMEEVGREIIAPNLASADKDFQNSVKNIFAWTENV